MYTKLVTRFYFSIVLCLLVLSCPIKISAQQNYVLERLNSENGLPTNAVKGLQFDEKNRFLWVATESGIVRYNGHGFQSFGNTSTNEQLNGRIVFFEKAVNGTLFGKLIDETVFKIKDNKAVIDSTVKKISWQHEYLKYKYGLKNLVYNGSFNILDYYDYKINNFYYFITDDKLQVLRNNKIDTLVNLKISTQGFIINNRFLLLQSDGVIKEIISKQNGDVKLYSISNLASRYKQFEYFPSQIRVFQNGANKKVYILIGNALYTLVNKGNSFSLDIIIDKLPKNEFIRYLQIDPVTSAIYLGTDNRGVIIAYPKYFNRILPNNLKEGVSTSTYAQFELNNGNIQINTGQVFGNSKANAALVFKNPSETNILKTKDNRLFFTNTNGIIEYDLLKNTTISSTKKEFVNRNSFVEIGDSIFAFNEFGVILKKPNKSWGLILKFKKAPFNFIVYNITYLGNNEILLATTDGLYKYLVKENIFKRIFKDKTNANFRSIYNLGGYYLLGTYGGGIYMYKNDTIKQLPLDQNQYLKFAHCFIEDNQNRIWASSNKGLFMSPKQSLIDFWNIGPGKIVYKYYGKLEGIDILEMNGGCSPCAIKLKNGHFSFPGIDGLIQFNPSIFTENEIVPNVYLDHLLIDDKFVNVNILNNIKSKISKLTFELGISGMLTQENIRFEYKLDNQNIWVPIQIKNPLVNLENPSYGSHVLKVRVRSTFSSKWQNIEYEFYINYPWYLNPWMYLVYIILLIGLIYLFIYFKTLIYKRRQAFLETEVAIKTDSLNKINKVLQKRNEAKDHIIAIMNHDILTPLKYMHITAKNIAESNNDDQIKTSIKQIAKTSKELEYLTSNMLNWVKFDNIERLPRKQEFNLYFLVNDLVEFVQPFVQNKYLQIINEVQTETSISNWPDSLRVLLYNLLVNAIKATQSGNIRICYQNINGGYIITVKDTGIGMSKSMVEFLLKGKYDEFLDNHPKFKTGNGVGYQIIRNIVQLMNADLDIESIEHKGTSVNIVFL